MISLSFNIKYILFEQETTKLFMKLKDSLLCILLTDWELMDPAIVHSGHLSNDGPNDEPHWMASLHNLTEDPVPQGAYNTTYNAV